MKRTRKNKQKILYGLAIFALLLAMLPMMETYAATIDFGDKVVALKTKFPHGKYWNKAGKDSDNSDGYTSTPCSNHKTTGVDCVYGTGGCTCNHFTGGGGHLMATQCMGYANKLGYDVFGDTTWNQITISSSSQLDDIKVGDILRVNYGGHSVFVIARTGDEIMVAEANYPNGCRINWGRVIQLSAANATYYERAANYSTVLGAQTLGVEECEKLLEVSAEEPSETEEEVSIYTGWKKAADGVHYQYYKSGTLQKKKWLTIKKKKYYVDKKGYRVTGFCDIKKKTYYFNSKGVLQKSKWFEVDDNIYYVNKKGVVLKSQWLYYKGKLVYVTADGSMARSEIVKIGSKQYYFNSKGNRSKGFKKYKGKYYYTDKKGVIQKKKWITKSGKKYYLQKSGVRAQSKLLKIGKYNYYFNSKGQMVKSKTVTYKGKKYKADKKGRCKYIGKVETTEQTTTETTTEATTGTTETASETTTEKVTEVTTETVAMSISSI